MVAQIDGVIVGECADGLPPLVFSDWMARIKATPEDEFKAFAANLPTSADLDHDAEEKRIAEETR